VIVSLFTLDLRSLILVLALGTSLLTLSHTMHGSYQAERDLLLQQNLDSNQIYAQKLAQSTSHFLDNLQHQVAYSASMIQENLSNPLVLQTETQRLREQNLSFNSVVLTNHNALALATSPSNLGL